MRWFVVNDDDCLEVLWRIVMIAGVNDGFWCRFDHPGYRGLKDCKTVDVVVIVITNLNNITVSSDLL